MKLIESQSLRAQSRKYFVKSYQALFSVKGALLGRSPQAPYSLQMVSPNDVHYAVTGATCSKIGVRIPFILDGTWDQEIELEGPSGLAGDLSLLPTGIIAIEKMDVYQAFKDRFSHGCRWQTTEFYRRVSLQIECGHRKWSCRNIQEFEARLDFLDRLFETIGKHGYKTQLELGTHKVWHEIAVGEAKKGVIVLVDGRHRFLMCKLLGLDSVPVVVAVRDRTML